MSFIKGFLHLIRIVNLLFILITQLLFYYLIVIPTLSFYGLSASIGGIHLALLVISTMLIAAAGYIINDYFDLKIDQINKPEQITIDRSIDRNAALLFHSLLNLIGIIIGFYVALVAGRWFLGVLHILTSMLLWLYSVRMKRQFLIGNVVVSLLTALVIILVALYTAPFGEGAKIGMAETTIGQFAIIYAVFAFTISMIREIIKDIQDLKGDRDYHCQTIPVVLGVVWAKRVAMLLSAILIVGVGVFQFILLSKQQWILPFYGLLTIQLPLVYFISKTNNASRKEDFGHLSNTVKWIMLAGILSMILIYFTASPANFLSING